MPCIRWGEIQTSPRRAANLNRESLRYCCNWTCVDRLGEARCQARDSVDEREPPRPPMALAMEWVSRITTVALEMVLPGVFGGWLDKQFGTAFLALAGFVLGFAVGFWHLLRMTKAAGRRSAESSRSAHVRVLDSDPNLESDTEPPSRHGGEPPTSSN